MPSEGGLSAPILEKDILLFYFIQQAVICTEKEEKRKIFSRLKFCLKVWVEVKQLEALSKTQISL